jgi:hypothetical protein
MAVKVLYSAKGADPTSVKIDGKVVLQNGVTVAVDGLIAHPSLGHAFWPDGRQFTGPVGASSNISLAYP